MPHVVLHAQHLFLVLSLLDAQHLLLLLVLPKLLAQFQLLCLVLPKLDAHKQFLYSYNIK
jgi:hypothetical protein